MPEITVQLVVFVVCVGLFTAVAAVMDIRTRRIPNKLTVPVFGLGLVYQLAFNHLPGLADAGLAFLLGFGLLFVLWMIGGGGGGDVKLMGALSVWLGFRLTLLVLVSSTVFVILATAAAVLWELLTRGLKRTKRKFLATGKQVSKKKRAVKETVDQKGKRRVMAYALPVAVATWCVVIYKLPAFPFLQQ